MKPMPKAYSYLRFSRPEQMKGDSLRRQTEAARDYAKRNGLDLDESLSFKDLGVSAYRGKNFHEGALGAFLKAVEAGRIRKGSYLLVEALDRLSRDTVDEAYDRFRNILKRDIVVVTLMGGAKVYTAESLRKNPADLFISLVAMMEAHKQSADKSERLSASWQNKRNKAQADGTKLTAKCPAWLTLASDRQSYVIDSERKKVVRRIFDMTIAGHGKSVIARCFNAEPVATFGESKGSKGWQPSYIQKILDNEAVCGVFQPMRIEMKDGKRTRVPEGDPIADYYPVVVDRATFERARRSRAARRIPAGRKGEHYSNLFTGLAVCGECGAPMHFVNKGNGSKGGAYLQCSNARRAVSNCKARSWRYGPVEAFLISCLEELDYGELFPDITSISREALRALEDEKLEKEAQLAKTKEGLERIADAVQAGKQSPTGKQSRTLMDRLDRLEADTVNLEAALATLETQIEDERDRAKNAERDFEQVQDGLQRLDKAHKTRGDELYDLRSRLHQLLRRTVQEIKLSPTKGPRFVLEITVRFQSTKIGRMLHVEKGLKTCQSFPMTFSTSASLPA